MDCKKQANQKQCTCTYRGCPRKGICCECISYHRQRKELPACYFSKEAEKAFDRSIDYFIKTHT